METKINSMEEFIKYFEHKENEKIINSVCFLCYGKITRVKNLNLVRCTRKSCRQQRKFHENDLFKKSKINSTMILKIVFMWCKNTKIKNICEILGISKKVVRSVLKNLENLLEKMKKYYKTKIGGNKMIVEVDESKFGKRKFNKGHHVDGVWIIGGVERSENKKINLEIIKKRNTENIDLFFKNNINIDSIVLTDCWRGYNNVQKNGYQHNTVNHSKFFKDPQTLIHTNTIEGNWNGIKQQVPPRCRTIKKIQMYLNLVMLKRNYKNDYFKLLIDTIIK